MLKKIIFIICMLIGILSCGNSKTLKIAVDGSEKTNLEIIGKVKEDMEKQGYKVEILEAPGQRMFLKEYVKTYIATTQSKSINSIITILEIITTKIIK